MRKLSVLFAAMALSASAAPTATAQDLRPRILDTPAGGAFPHVAALDRGRVVVDWNFEQEALDKGAPDTGAGMVIDISSGAVVHRFARQSSRETLTGDTHERGRESADRVEVLYEKTRDTGAWSDPVRVLDLVDMKQLLDLPAHEKPLAAVRAEAGLVIATGGAGIVPGTEPTAFTLRLWDAGAPRPRWSFDVPTTKPGAEAYASAAVTLSPDGRWVTTMRDGVLYLLDAATGSDRIAARLSEAGSGAGGHGLAVGFSRDGILIYVVAGGDASGETIVVKRVADLADVRRIVVPGEFRVRHIVEHEGGRMLELGGVRRTLFLDVASRQFVRHDRGSSTSSYRLARLGTDLLWRASRTRNSPIIYGVYRHTGGKFEQLYKREWARGEMSAMTWSPNGRCIVMSGGGRSAVLASESGKQLATLGFEGDSFDAASFAMDGARLVGIDGAMRVLVYDMPTVCSGT